MGGRASDAEITLNTPKQGQLFYVIGASGSGKDSLLHYARRHLPEHARLMFAHRYITRSADAGGENHIALSAHEFELRTRLNCFAMHWHSNGLHYGIGEEINIWRERGTDVVINGSRGYLPEAMRRYPQLLPILIQAPEAQLLERLQKRGRESAEAVEQRIRQARQLDQALSRHKLHRISNDDQLAIAGEQLLQILLHSCDNDPSGAP